MELTLAELSIEPLPTILETTIAQMSMVNNSYKTLRYVILKFYDSELIRENLRNQFESQKNDKGYTSMLAALLYIMKMKETIKIADFIMEFTMYSDDAGNVILKLWDLRTDFPKMFEKIKDEFANLLKKQNFKSFPPRIAALFQDIKL
jgi:hypothetical protein